MIFMVITFMLFSGEVIDPIPKCGCFVEAFHLSISFLNFQASLLKNPTLYLGSSSNFTARFL